MSKRAKEKEKKRHNVRQSQRPVTLQTMKRKQQQENKISDSAVYVRNSVGGDAATIPQPNSKGVCKVVVGSYCSNGVQSWISPHTRKRKKKQTTQRLYRNEPSSAIQRKPENVACLVEEIEGSSVVSESGARCECAWRRFSAKS